MNKFKIICGSMMADTIIPEIGKFPGGEIRVKLNAGFNLSGSTEARIEALLFNSDDVMTLVMLVDALRESGVHKLRLTMPYIPYARQDRVCTVGEAFSIRAFARIINSLNFTSVVVWDAHSDVSVALIDGCINTPTQTLIQRNPDISGYLLASREANIPVYLVAPDAGSVKKSQAIAAAFPENIAGVVYAQKVRELATGKILKTEVTVPYDAEGHSLIDGANLLICDDICDGGRTFTELAKVLQPYTPNSMSLYVTHGIFSQGIEVLLNKKSEPEHEIGTYFNEHTGLFDNVWCSVDFRKYK